MTDRIYRGDYGIVIYANCGKDVSAATDTKLRVQYPGGKTAEWTATIHDTNYLKYTTVDGDFDEIGTYGIQSKMVLGDWNGLGKTAWLKIYEPGA